MLVVQVLFDAEGCLRRFERVDQILEEFFRVRRQKYIERKRYLEGMLQAQSERLSNQARFILEKIDGKIHLENKKKRVIVEQLIAGKYDPDPVKKWKDEIRRKVTESAVLLQCKKIRACASNYLLTVCLCFQEEEQGGDISADEVSEEEEMATEEREVAVEESPVEKRLADYDYLVTMQLIKLSEEEKEKLLRERDTKLRELRDLQAKTWTELWTADIDAFCETLDVSARSARPLGLAQN